MRWRGSLSVCGAMAVWLAAGPMRAETELPPESTTDPQRAESLVRCANLVYGQNKSSVCFSDKFLRQTDQETPIRADGRFHKVSLESDTLFAFPFAIMTGEGQYQLTAAQRKNLATYLERGGFLLASAGCSSPQWDECFRSEIAKVFPKRKLKKLEMTHPVFHTVHDIDRLRMKKVSQVQLEGLEIDGRLVLIYSAQGLNDTANAGKGCCCCGGDEILNAQAVNVNILAYALTH